jgi:LysM repeat protein
MHANSQPQSYSRRPAILRLTSMALLAALLLLGVAQAAQAQEAPVHIVQPGETLSELAKEYGVSADALLRLNGLDDADLIWVGLPLRLPAGIANAPTSVPQTAIFVPRPDRPTHAEDASAYTVAKGDTLGSIAAAHGVSMAQLVALNRISPAQRLTAGQRLLVPHNNMLATGERLYTVRPGESWNYIAQKYRTTLDDLLERNGLTTPSVLRPGQEIVVPPVRLFESMADLPEDENGHHIVTQFPTTTEKWIDVDLSEQRVIAWEGTRQVKDFLISSGKGGSPTVTGEFRIWIKTAVQDMFGGDRAASDYYYLRNVKWVQYFYEDYSFHSTYWHDNFGEPMSRGCINMRTEDAKWLFDWAGPDWDPDGEDWQRPTEDNPGTLVIVHQ